MTLSEKQANFTYNISKLIQWAFSNGYTLTFGEVYRTKEQQELYVKQGKSKTMNSRHLDRLAVDFNIFKDSVLLNDPKLIQPLGEYWMTLNVSNVWGNDWNRNHSIMDETFSDPYHFEMKP
tara:strand:- start:42 stop:404 length:363 start_codon:yes stop_codon:yes gene_type:complete